MKRILTVAQSEFMTLVKTKAFIIGILMTPALMTGFITFMSYAEGHVDTTDRAVAVIDQTGVLYEPLAKAVARHNEEAGAGVIIAAEIGFPGPGIDRRQAAWSKGDGTHGKRILIIGARHPIIARVLGFPDATLGGTYKPVVGWVHGIHRQGRNPSAAKAPNAVRTVSDRCGSNIVPNEGRKTLWARLGGFRLADLNQGAFISAQRYFI